MHVEDALILLVIIAGAYLSFKTGKLDLTAAVTGATVALCLYAGAGYAGLLLLGLFFVFSSLATAWKKELKNKEASSPRNFLQVLANGGVAALLAIGTLLFPEKAPLLKLMMAGSMAAATADTLSSEMGIIIGRRFYNIVTLKKEERGLDGVISLEGTLAGAAGSMLIALGYFVFSLEPFHIFQIVFAGVAGNAVDSIAGALFERRGYIGNHLVNLINTAAGAGFILVFYLL